MRPVLLRPVALLFVAFGGCGITNPLAGTKVNLQMPELGDADFPFPSPSLRHDQKVRDARDRCYDVVLVGDSITQALGELGGKYEPMKEVWKRHFAPSTQSISDTTVIEPSKFYGICRTANSTSSRNPK